MADRFTEALDELKDALTNGEELEAALASVAADHDIRPEALRNRATLRWGDLERRAEELSTSVGVELEKKLAASRLRKCRDIMLRMHRSESYTSEEADWYFSYTYGMKHSPKSRDKRMVASN